MSTVPVLLLLRHESKLAAVVLERVAMSGIEDWVCILTTIWEMRRFKRLTMDCCFISDWISFIKVPEQMAKTICTRTKREIKLLITQIQSLRVQ